jgi:tetratricopeptide (TPR) repeat protein
MGKSLSNRCSHVLLLLCAGLASGKQLPIQEVPASGLSPESLSTLPLEVPQRVALEQAYKSRNYPRAETLLVAEIERNPKSADMLTVLGTIFFLDGKYLNCAIAMKKAEAISPLPDQNRFILALSYIVLGRRDWARPELEKLARLNQRDARYPYWLGRLDYDAMQFHAAVSHLQTAIELDPTYMKAYDNLGLSFEGLGQYDDAIRIYQQAINLNRQQAHLSPWPPLNLGTLLVKLGRLQEAQASLRESLRSDSQFPKAHYQMGLLLEKEKKSDEAIHELNLAARFDSADPEPHYALAGLYQRLGVKERAEAEWKTFEKLKKDAPREPPF